MEPYPRRHFQDSCRHVWEEGEENPDWFEDGAGELEPVIASKRQALLNYKQDPSEKTLAALRKTSGDAQRVAKQCANNYWQNLCQDIQRSADCGNVRAMYEGMKKAFGPSAIKTAPLKSSSGEVITDRAKQMERWAEQYTELYSRETVVTDKAVEKTSPLPVMEELDAPPTVEELSKAIESLASGKAPGSDSIPLRSSRQASSRVYWNTSTNSCYNAGRKELCLKTCVTSISSRSTKTKASAATVYNYRGISLLSIVGKTFARVVLNRLQLLAERVYPEAQCGFRAERSTIDMIFSPRQLQEKCREQRRPLYIAFIDLTKAFDLVSRSGLFTLLQRIGCPPTLLRFITSFHENMQGTVQYDGSSTDPFPIKSGVKQGCVLAPTLFGILFSLLPRYAFSQTEEGVYIH